MSLAFSESSMGLICGVVLVAHCLFMDVDILHVSFFIDLISENI